MLYIQASNIHLGGGFVLLQELINSLEENKYPAHIFVDSRIQLTNQALKTVQFTFVRPTIFHRLLTEIKLHQIAKKEPHSHFLFFGNLPPLFSSNNNASLFFQNVILLNPTSFSFNFKTKLKHLVEFVWLRQRLQFIQTVFVQTQSVKNIFQNQFPDTHVQIRPFSPTFKKAMTANSARGNFFIYVASGDPHKNHSNLLKAWILLQNMGIKNKLILTTDTFGLETQTVYKEALSLGVDIEIRLNLSHSQIVDLYPQALALIYPSYTESFGLPLIEAQLSDTPIISAELDYVRDVVTPQETFDPNSPISIARAVQRFLKISNPSNKISTGSEFVAEILALK